MQKIVALTGAFLLCCSFSDPDQMACAYAGSNLGYIKSQTEKALSAIDIKTSRFFVYRALNAIEKSRKQLQACGCEYASRSMEAGTENLKLATKVSSLTGTRILLTRALDNTFGGLEALEGHDEMHKSEYASDLLALNTRETEVSMEAMKPLHGKVLEQKIDQSLLRYAESLEKVIRTVECKEARAFAFRIYNHCEQELLKPNLSEAKKYYNLRTKEITKVALDKLDGCGK